MRAIICAMLLAVAGASQAEDKTVSILNKQSGTPALSDVQVDTAPGTVSAAGLLSVSGDAVKDVQNPRDLTMLLRAFDSSKTFGISLTPARTPLVSVPLSSLATDDAHGTFMRLVSSTTFGYAQSTASVNGADYQERAWSVEASASFGDDDPVVAWSKALAAGAHKDKESCGPFVAARLPSASPQETAASASGDTTRTPAEATPIAARELDNKGEAFKSIVAQRTACEAHLNDIARWNTSRIWASFASGSFKGNASGSPSHGLGRTFVVGLSYGVGDNNSPTQAQLTLGFKRGVKQPVLDTFADASLQLKSTTLGTLRLAIGKTRLRGLVEASNVHDTAPDATDRTFKRAFGLDVQVYKGTWLNFRVGRQRRIDNSGDETGSTIQLNLSPSALVNFGS